MQDPSVFQPISWLYYVSAGLIVVVAALLFSVRRKNQPFMPGDVFYASRWTRGNHLFPTQVGITPSSVVQYTPRVFGKREESIHIVHVASIKIDTHLLFADVLIETSGGVDPIVCHGHGKEDAARIKELIEQYQSNQYRLTRGPTTLPGPTRTCPFCAETIKAEAKVCRYCGRDLPVREGS